MSRRSDLVESGTRGDPMRSLSWTLKSTRVLAGSLGDMGHRISSWTVGELLRSWGLFAAVDVEDDRG